jgi:hypothetical protein
MTKATVLVQDVHNNTSSYPVSVKGVRHLLSKITGMPSVLFVLMECSWRSLKSQEELKNNSLYL